MAASRGIGIDQTIENGKGRSEMNAGYLRQLADEASNQIAEKLIMEIEQSLPLIARNGQNSYLHPTEEVAKTLVSNRIIDHFANQGFRVVIISKDNGPYSPLKRYVQLQW